MTKPIWFDTSITNFKNSPKLTDFGLHSATLMNTWGFFRVLGGVEDYSHIDMETCKRVANHPTYWIGKESDMIVLDVEVLDMHTDDLCQRDLNHDQHIQALEIYREAHPGCAIGYYSTMPELDYYGPLGNSGIPGWSHYKEHYEKWVARNKHFLTNVNNGDLTVRQHGLADVVDRVFPSVYQPIQLPLPENMRWWKIVHDGNVEEAAKYRKPIVMYLCPQYEDTTNYLPAGSFREMLSHSVSHPQVTGVCIYQSVVGNPEFDATADWWKETLEVVANG